MWAIGRAIIVVIVAFAGVISIAPAGPAQLGIVTQLGAVSEHIDRPMSDEGVSLHTSGRNTTPRSDEVAAHSKLNSDERRHHGSVPQPRGPARGFLPRPGARVFHLAIPSIGVSEWVVQGTDQAQLARGPGHYPDCAGDFSLPYCSRFDEVWPGEKGRVIVGGHRTLATRPFFDLGEVRRGDRILIRASWGRFVYVVRKTAVVAATDNSVIADGVPRRELMLVTCHPKFSAAQRLLVFSKLVRARSGIPAVPS